MSKPTQEQINDLLQRGIKPRALIACAKDGDNGIVQDVENWNVDGQGWIGVGFDRKGYALYAFVTGSNFSYATVITPAPEAHALKDGDYVVRTDKAMHDRLMELCDKAGVEVSFLARNEVVWPMCLAIMSDAKHLQNIMLGYPDLKRELTEAQFVAALFGVAPEEPVKELTLEKAKDLLRESIGHVLNNDVVGQRKWADKLAEYGIKP